MGYTFLLLSLGLQPRLSHRGLSALAEPPPLPFPALALVGVTGFEPVTLRLSSACSNQLSYTPNIRRATCAAQVEARGFEPLTYSLQSYRSTN